MPLGAVQDGDDGTGAEMKAQGLGATDIIAEALGIDRASVYRVLEPADDCRVRAGDPMLTEAPHG